MSADLRQLIREVLNEELAAFRARGVPSPTRAKNVETVAISSDTDLGAFARRVLTLGRDAKIRGDIESGRYEFRLTREPGPSGEVAGSTAVSGAPASFDRGLITENQIKALAPGTTCVRAGKSVRFTPLARDEMRKMGIKVERTLL